MDSFLLRHLILPSCQDLLQTFHPSDFGSRTSGFTFKTDGTSFRRGDILELTDELVLRLWNAEEELSPKIRSYNGTDINKTIVESPLISS